MNEDSLKALFPNKWSIEVERGSVISLIATVDSQFESLTRHNILKSSDVSRGLLSLNQRQKEFLEAYLEDLNELKNVV